MTSTVSQLLSKYEYFSGYPESENPVGWLNFWALEQWGLTHVKTGSVLGQIIKYF